MRIAVMALACGAALVGTSQAQTLRTPTQAQQTQAQQTQAPSGEAAFVCDKIEPAANMPAAVGSLQLSFRCRPFSGAPVFITYAKTGMNGDPQNGERAAAFGAVMSSYAAMRGAGVNPGVQLRVRAKKATWTTLEIYEAIELGVEYK